MPRDTSTDPSRSHYITSVGGRLKPTHREGGSRRRGGACRATGCFLASSRLRMAIASFLTAASDMLLAPSQARGGPAFRARCPLEVPPRPWSRRCRTAAWREMLGDLVQIHDLAHRPDLNGR